MTCLPRGASISRSPTTAQAARADVQGEEHERVNHPTHEDTAVLPELSIVDLSTRVSLTNQAAKDFLEPFSLIHPSIAEMVDFLTKGSRP